MRRIRIVLGLLLGAAAIVALALTGTAPLTTEAQPALQAGGENCVACHTDKETLQALAVEEEEEEEELSEGEG